MKVKTKPKLPVTKRNAVPALRRPDDDAATVFAQVALHPTFQALHTIQNYSKAMDDTHLDLDASLVELTKQLIAVSGGNLGRVEAMLLAQAHSLDAIYGNLARRAAVQDFLPQIDGLLRLALKAQSQCRATLEALAAIKNPPLVYARQANVTTGPQQINNGTAAPSQAREIENLQSKLLEARHGERLDIGTTKATSETDPQMATVGKIERTANSGRKRASIKKR